MNKLIGAICVAAITLLSTVAMANGSQTHYVYGKVVMINPIYTNIHRKEPRNVCKMVQVPVYGTVTRQGNAGEGALAGMIIGGILGKGVTGKDNGAAAGAVIGGIIGADRAGTKQEQVVTGYRNEKQCHTEYMYVNDSVVNEYDVTYDIEGRRVTYRVNREIGKLVYNGQQKRFRIRYQLMD